MPHEGVDALVHTLESEDFALRIQDRDGFITKTRVIPLIHGATGMPLDLVLAGPGREDLFLSRAVVAEIDGVRVPVASPEDVVVYEDPGGPPERHR
ncbi:MAG: hypothetical protein U0Q16_24830 [Bryobacteraceae bacterium]